MPEAEAMALRLAWASLRARDYQAALDEIQPVMSGMADNEQKTEAIAIVVLASVQLSGPELALTHLETSWAGQLENPWPIQLYDIAVRLAVRAERDDLMLVFATRYDELAQHHGQDARSPGWPLDVGSRETTSVHSLVGQRLLDRGMVAEAAPWLRKTVGLRTGDTHAACCLAVCYETMGLGNHAVDVLSTALKTSPDSAEVHYALGTILLDRRPDDATAVSLLERAIGLFTTDGTGESEHAKLAVGTCLLRLRRYSEARKCLVEFGERSPEASARLKCLACAEEARYNLKEALSCWDAYLHIQKQSAVSELFGSLSERRTVSVLRGRPRHESHNGRDRRLRIFVALHLINSEYFLFKEPLDFLGYDVVFFDWGNPDVYSQEWLQVGRPRASERLVEAVEAAHRERPIDLFFSYLSFRHVLPDAIRAINDLKIVTLNFCWDDMLSLYAVEDLAPVFGFSWTTYKKAVPRYKEIGARPVFAYPGANPRYFRRFPLDRTVPVSFVGKNYSYRASVLEELSKRGIGVETAGDGYSRKLSLDNMILLFNVTRVNLGFSGAGVGEFGATLTNVKGRDFEVPMSGGFYLTEYCDELQDVYEIGKEIACYSSLDELAEMIPFYLKHQGERERIGRSGYRRAQCSHTTEKAFECILKRIGLQ